MELLQFVQLCIIYHLRRKQLVLRVLTLPRLPRKTKLNDPQSWASLHAQSLVMEHVRTCRRCLCRCHTLDTWAHLRSTSGGNLRLPAKHVK